MQGEWWRLFTFLIEPPHVSFLFIAFSWWIFFMMGSALEEYWGDFHYNLFLLVGYVLTVGLSFLQPDWYISNQYLYGTVFLAFAYLNPDFEFVLFFILPVKVKWLALITWCLYGYANGCRIMVPAPPDPGRSRLRSLFFGKDIVLNMKANKRRMTPPGKASCRVRK